MREISSFFSNLAMLYFCIGIAKVGEKGQIVIPKEARDMFDIKPGDTVVVLCDKKKGMAIVKSEVLEDTMDKIMPDGK